MISICQFCVLLLDEVLKDFWFCFCCLSCLITLSANSDNFASSFSISILFLYTVQWYKLGFQGQQWVRLECTSSNV